ncbi:Spo0E family sporulation regulatory protein-aspartic acid phosphatase [Clostridium sp.]|jgi:hypothetical protein|uniref:Spo0E family sporulation regulatory protein-aspartic acid phosphatase n=1 Tax=Clostridium sp. TaxID=1506 RepID=UPI0039F4EDC3
MEETLKILDKRIQYWREKLHNLLYLNGPLEDEVLNCSRHLDRLLVEYEKHRQYI